MNKTVKEKIFYNAFNQIPQIGSVRFRKLTNFFPDIETAWNAGQREYLEAGLNEKLIYKILEAKQNIDPDKEFGKLTKQNIELMTINDSAYPEFLKQIPKPPITLYILGKQNILSDLSVAVVGTRKVSPYGKRVTEDITRGLIRANVTIVSGLALGTDTVAHQTTVNGSGKTVAVLASGLDKIYPASNRFLSDKILETGGALISELPLGSPPLKHNFPNRNRIISGLCLGSLIIEAAEKSGALITAEHALEQNRQVYAIPGSIYSETSVGPHNLLKMGAKPVTEALDILEDLQIEDRQNSEKVEEIIGDNEEEQMILDLLTNQPKHADQVAKESQLPSSKVASTLTILEMKGKVKNLGANQYVLRK